MAIDGLVKAGTETKWGISEESTFGTAIADNGTFVMMEGPPPTVDEGIIRNIDAKFNGMRVPSDSDDFYSQEGGVRVISFSDMTVRKNSLADLLYAASEIAIEAAATPYQKQYIWTSTTTQPDFSANAGYFCTVGIYEPLTAKDRKFTSCILRTLTLTADLSGDGRLKASGEFISGFSSSAASTFSGTWAYADAEYINFNNMSLKQVGGTDVVVYGFDWTITNNAVRVGADATGDAETYFIGGGGGYSVTGNLLLKYDTATDDLIADGVAGTARSIQLSVGSDGVDGYLSLFCDGAIIGDADKNYDDERGQAVSVPFTAIHKNAAAMASVNLADAEDRSWPAA